MTTKIPKACVDLAVGYQTFNTMGDNLDELKSALEAEHIATEESASSLTVQGSRTQTTYDPAHSTSANSMTGHARGLGRHDHTLIPRGVAYVETFTDGAGDTSARIAWSVGALTSMEIISTGVYFFPVAGFTSFMGKATPEVDESVQTDASCEHGSYSGLGGGLLVRTMSWDTSGSYPAFTAAHTGFHLVMWARRGAAPWNPALGALPFMEETGRQQQPRRPIPWHGFVRV